MGIELTGKQNTGFFYHQQEGYQHMPVFHERLTDDDCINAEPGPKVRKLTDGAGLQLWIQPTGSRHWRFAYRFNGKQKLYAIGPYPLITILEAREAAFKARKQVAHGIDPMAIRREEKIKAAASAATFEMIAAEFVEKARKEGRAPNTLKKLNWLISLANADLGRRSISDLKPPDILVPLKRLEAKGHYESARRLRSTIGGVFRFAVASGRADTDPTTPLQGALITPKSTPRPAIIDPRELGELLRKIDAYPGYAPVRAALQLMPILFPRPGEMRQARWDEFDLEKAIWSIPAERMKMRKPHLVPLPKQAIAILADLKPITGDGPVVFPGPRSAERPISNTAMNVGLRRLGYGKDQMVPHGFRATASTLLNESGKWRADVIERQLAHVEQNEVRRVYSRAEFMDERRKMMKWWGKYLDKLKNA